MFSGAITAMVTPFREGRLDEGRLREQVEYQIKNGIDGLVPVGTTGESPTLDFKEHARVTMSAQTVARLSEHPRVVAIKEATGSLDMASEIRSLCPITILSGDDSLTVPLMSIGAKGVISVASNLLPAEVKAMAQAALA